MEQVRCPHCAKPLEVRWEVYRYWGVALDADGQPVLDGGGPDEFEGGECSECNEWVEPSQLAKPQRV